MAFRPPFCPNPRCSFHLDPESSEGKKLRRVAWFRSFGSYYTKVRGWVPRYRCLACGKTCGRQTFRLDYYVKRTVSYQAISTSITNCSSVRATARSLRISPESVLNRISRLARQYIAGSAQLLSQVELQERLVSDGFESFCRSQFYPNAIHLLTGARSQYLFIVDYATLRRKGRMTDEQKRMRHALEQLYDTDPKALITSFSTMLDTVEELRGKARVTPLVLTTDKKSEYTRALSRHPKLREAMNEDRLVHQRVSSRQARTYANPLFAVNYLDREMRKDLAEHVRETVRFARNVNHSMERLWIFIGTHNLRKRFRINDPVSLTRTHADEAGIPGETQKQALKRITTVRRFLSFQSLPTPMEQAWRRGYDTPLRDVVPKVLKTVKKAVHEAEENIDVSEVVKSLDVESIIVPKRQYLPAYALG